MADQDTAQNNGTATVASANATDASSLAGQQPTQPTNAQGVDNGSVEDKGNSAASDGRDGADGAGDGRQRPGRAERTISQLTSRIRELESALDTQGNLSVQLQRTPVDGSQVNLPDYSQMTEITPEQIKKDIITAASQIVDLKMQTTANVLETKMSLKQASEKSAQAIENALTKYPVLNPDSEDYDQSLDKELSDSYAAILQKDPSYSFSKFIKPMERFLQDQSKSSESTTTTGPSSRGTSANRSGGGSRTQKPFDQMTTTEMEAWFASKRS